MPTSTEPTMFDLVWARQDQWGGEWHALGGFLRIAEQLLGYELEQFTAQPTEDYALGEVIRWMLDVYLKPAARSPFLQKLEGEVRRKRKKSPISM